MVAPNLTAKQIAYADAVLDGETGSAAYRSAYNTRGSNKVVSVKAAELLAHSGVQAYLGTERAKLNKKKIVGREASLQKLGEIINDPKATHTEVIRAIERNAKMQGFDAPQKSEVQVTGSLLQRIRQGKRTTVNPTA